MRVEFTKMHGCGNDYVYINGFTQHIPQEEKADFVRMASDRHFGIGGDGVIFINPSEVADFEMEMYNMDGSRAEMCGNGIRCVAGYVYEKGLTDKTEISIVSAGSIKYLVLTVEGGKVQSVRVDMGMPILAAEQIPVAMTGDRVVNVPIEACGQTWNMTCVSMGNPHCIVYVDDVDGMDLEKIGPCFENHPLFPKRINTEFVQILSPSHVKMRVWERGSGETLACGTGCSALCAAGVLNGVTERDLRVDVVGGTLQILWDEKDSHIYMTGPAVIVFDGSIDWK